MLYAGFSALPIVHDTQKIHYLGGFSGRGPATGVLDYPEARTILLRNNALTVAVVSLDFCYLDHGFISEIRQQLSKELGVMSVIACTHNHAGICAVHSKDNILGIVNEGYLDLVRQSIFKSIERAKENVEKVEHITSHRATLVGNFIMNRTFVDSEGFMHKKLQSHTPATVFKDFDREIIAMKFSTKNEDFVIANFACHANVLDRSNTLVGRDFVGPMLETLEKNLGDRKTSAIFLNGAAGDVRPAVWESSLKTAAAFGGMLGVQIALAVKSKEEILEKSISFHEVDVPIAFVDGSNLAVPVSCLRVGNHALITVPGELYSSLSLQIKEAGGAVKPMIVCYANGTLGYLPDKKCVEQNHPEDVAIRSRTVQKYFDGPLPLPDLGERIMEGAVFFLK